MSESKKITIFLVDDNVLYLRTLEMTFVSKPYYHVQTFSTGEQCLEQLAVKPDVIILDYYLNSVKKDAIDGLETLKKIREKNSSVPVIILSTEVDPKVKEACLNHKATEYIIKSDISFARLREIITAVFIDKAPTEDLISHVHNAIHSNN